jgi:hypothetical protein
LLIGGGGERLERFLRVRRIRECEYRQDAKAGGDYAERGFESLDQSPL